MQRHQIQVRNITRLLPEKCGAQISVLKLVLSTYFIGTAIGLLPQSTISRSVEFLPHFDHSTLVSAMVSIFCISLLYVKSCTRCAAAAMLLFMLISSLYMLIHAPSMYDFGTQFVDIILVMGLAWAALMTSEIKTPNQQKQELHKRHLKRVTTTCNLSRTGRRVLSSNRMRHEAFRPASEESKHLFAQIIERS